MLIVGERINTSRKPVDEAVEKHDTAYIAGDVKRQVQAGVDFIDVNAGSRHGRELDDLKWLVEVVEGAVETPLALDSPDAKVLLEMVKRVKKPPMVNSTTAEKKRFECMIPVIQERNCDIVALCMDDEGIPASVEESMKTAFFLVNELTKLGMPPSNIHLDPLTQPISVKSKNGEAAITAIRRIRKEFPEVKTICGVSNISFGLPNRFLLNRLFIVLCIGAGLTGAIVDPLDQKMMTHIIGGEALTGKDPYCMKYLKTYRTGQLCI
jgi:cobalamin-dependent methionine synthase I